MGWADDCPGRGPALRHAHWDRCQGTHPHDGDGHEGHEHAPDQCCHCDGFPGRAQGAPTREDPEQVPPPIDVLARMRAMGYNPANMAPAPSERDTGMEDIRAKEDPLHPSLETPVEPKAITGEGPKGSPYGRGRGEFTARDAWRAHTHVGFRQWLAENGGGEQE